MQTPALSGELYFVTFVDEALGRLAVALLRSKAEVFENFAIYRQHAENDTGKAVRSLRSDGGGEYMSKKFLTYLREAEIVKQTTPPYTPAQNGIAERANSTIMESARCMLADAQLGNEFWAYAVSATTHTLNRMPSRAHKGWSTIEILTGAKPSIAYIRVFGCPMHVLVPAETRGKLDPKSVTCMFVVYTEDQGMRVYKLYHEETKRVMTSRDVVFNEFPGEERAEETKLSAGEGLASTPLSQLIPKNRLISKHNQLSQRGDELIPQCKGPPTPATRLPSSTESSPLSSVYSDDGLEETITVRGPVLPLPSASTRATSLIWGQGNTISANESTGEQSGSWRPQRTRKPVQHFKPTA